VELKYLLIIMALLYILPELFRRKPKKYEYPTIPESMPNKPYPDVPKAEPLPIIKPNTVTPKAAMPPEVHIPVVAAEPSPWQGQLTMANIQTGYIFAEILQPPRAYRPIKPSRGLSPRPKE